MVLPGFPVEESVSAGTQLWVWLDSPKPTIGDQVKHILIILSLFLFSLTVLSCAKKDSSSSTTSTTALVWDQGSWDSHNWQ